MKYFIPVIVGFLLGSFFVAIGSDPRASRNRLENTNIKIRQYKMYVMKTEALLDSINAYYSDFNDVIAEMDVYDEYLDVKDSLGYEAFQKLCISKSKEVWSLS